MAECEGCGKRIVWVVVNGMNIPLDPTPPVYELIGTYDGGWEPLRAKLSKLYGKGDDRRRGAMVSHFVTCPNREEFSGKGKK